MFCPQCGAEIASDRVRFCTHCRFPVGSMKEFIATETSKNEAEEGKKIYPLRQWDINLGAGLMLIGALKAILASMASPGSRDHEIAVLLFVLGVLFSAVTLFSQLSPRQRGLTVGATIMFAGSLLGIQRPRDCRPPVCARGVIQRGDFVFATVAAPARVDGRRNDHVCGIAPRNPETTRLPSSCLCSGCYSAR